MIERWGRIVLTLVLLSFLTALPGKTSAKDEDPKVIRGELKCTTERVYDVIGYDQFGTLYGWVTRENCARGSLPSVSRDRGCVPFFDVEGRLLAYLCP